MRKSARPSVDGRPAVLVYDQASVGTKTVTGLQYAIAAPGGRACYVTLVTEKPVPYEPAFGALRPAIHVMPWTGWSGWRWCAARMAPNWPSMCCSTAAG